jgi:hypothetical protein
MLIWWDSHWRKPSPVSNGWTMFGEKLGFLALEVQHGKYSTGMKPVALGDGWRAELDGDSTCTVLWKAQIPTPMTMHSRGKAVSEVRKWFMGDQLRARHHSHHTKLIW